MNAPVLYVDLSLDFPAFSLSVAEKIPLAGITALSGASGSGKTTLLRALAGLERDAKGRVQIGETVWQNGRTYLPTHKRNLGFVFQDARLFAHLNVTENINYGLRWQNRPKGLADDLIEALELGPLMKRNVSALSGGELRRVALARALATRPDLMLLDEPLSGLDATRKVRVLPFIARALLASGCPAIYVSHDRHETNTLADREIVMSGGKIIQHVKAGPVFEAKVCGDNGTGKSVLQFAGQQFTCRVGGVTGEMQKFRLAPQSLLISRNDPGQGTALFRTKISVLRYDGKTLVFHMIDDAPGIELRIEVTTGEDFNLSAGQALWLSVGDVDLLPNSSVS